VWQVFPFDFGGSSFNWGLLIRVVLVVVIVGSIIGIVVQVVTLSRTAVTGGASTRRHGEVRR
jgi:hypothetical protein